MITAGIDIGSTMTKAIILDTDQNHVLASSIVETGAEHRALALSILEETAKKAGFSSNQVSFIVGTGYGRLNIPFADKQITEITCHARGVHHLFPQARTIIEVGGQDSKAIKLTENGTVSEFTMNNKCAAGTGRFLECVSDTLEVSLAEMNTLALRAKDALPVSSLCAIFAQQEIIAALSRGTPVEVVLAGMYGGFARKIITMANPLRIEREVVLTGGTCKHAALQAALQREIGFELLIPEEPLLTGALGAALLAGKYGGRFSKEELSSLQARRSFSGVQIS